MKIRNALSMAGVLLAPGLFLNARAGIENSKASQHEVDHGAPAEYSVHELNPYDDSVPKAGNSHPSGQSRPSSNGISYHNGPVMLGTVNVYFIWYGNWSGNSALNILPDLASHIGGSSYFNINTTYYNGAQVHVSNSVKYGGYVNRSAYLGTSLSDSQIQTIVQDAINGANGTGSLPADSNGVYFVLTSADVTESSGFCTQYCGWHTHGTIAGTDIKYAFIGNPDRCPSACEAQSGSSPNGNTGADGMASIIAHELEESVTDPDLNAWYDSRGEENADKCAWTFGTTFIANGAYANMQLGSRYYLIQRNWVNANGGYCSLSN
jgi:hypothetical protein